MPDPTSNKARICLFGGTFDPIHLGHTYIAQQAMLKMALDKVIFLPCRQSPHKTSKQNAPDGDRLTMCDLATDMMPWAEVSNYDLTAPEPSYSWRTAEHFQQVYPEAELFWLMGTDQWNALNRWARIDYLSSIVTFIVFTRGGEALAPHAFRHRVIQGAHPASATKIRNDIAAAQTPRRSPWLHPDVSTFLSQTSLYQ